MFVICKVIQKHPASVSLILSAVLHMVHCFSTELHCLCYASSAATQDVENKHATMNNVKPTPKYQRKSLNYGKSLITLGVATLLT